jgi:outer membrane protein assembly factor BamB
VRLATTICCSAVALTALAAASHDIAPTALVPVRAVWTLPLNSQLTLSPAYDDTRAFFPLEQNRLVAYRIDIGKQLWLVESHPILQPAAGGDLVFVVESNRLVALKAADGSEAWEVPTSEPLSLPPVWLNGWVVVATARGAVTALRATDGHAMWSREVGAPPHARPTIAGERVYLSLTDGRIIALSLLDGSPQWARRIGGQPNEILALQDRLYVGSTDNFFYALLTKDGRIDWRWRTGADVIGAPVAGGSRVFFVSLDNMVRGMNAVSGAQLWLRALPLRPTAGPQMAGATLLVVGPSSTVRSFNVKDGTPGADIDAGDEITAPPHVVEDPTRPLPTVLFVTKHIVRGAAAALYTRSIDPAATPLIAPLPNVIMPAPTPATR